MQCLNPLKVGAVLAVLALPFVAIQGGAEPLRFVAYGDAAYVPEAEVVGAMRGLIDAINAHDPALVVHVGDTQGGQPCTNSMSDTQRGVMNMINAPVLYTPGDNEWRDCVDADKSAGHKFERLSYIRKTYFAGSRTLGANPVPVENQAARGYPENARLMLGNAGFITAHVVGSNNNFDPRSQRNTREYFARDAANVAWVRESFARFADAEAIVVAVHADMYEEWSGYIAKQGWTLYSPFLNFGLTVHQLSSEYEKPVLILFGDSHAHVVFQPAPKHRPFVTAIEVFGHPDIKAIEIEVDVSRKRPFRVVRKISEGG